MAGSIGAVAALWLVTLTGVGGDHARWLAFTSLVCSQVVRAYANRSLRTPLHRMARNGFLLGAAVLAVAIQVVIPYLPPLADVFRATPLSAGEWGLVALFALGPAVVAKVARTIRRTTWVA